MPASPEPNQPMRRAALIADGDAKSLRVLDMSFRQAGFDVRTASTGAAALALLEAAPPDVIVADAQIVGPRTAGGPHAEVDAYDLCRRVRSNAAWTTIPILVVSADDTLAARLRALEAGADEYLARPIYVNDLLTRAKMRLRRVESERLMASAARITGGANADPSIRFTGDLAEVTLVDLIEIVERSGRSGIVHLRNPAGVPGSIYFRSGQIIDAEAGRLSGADAVFRLFSWTRGSFEVVPKSIRRRDVIEQPPGALVIEGMRRLDEWNGIMAGLPGPDAVLEVNYRVLADRVAEIPDEVNGILRLLDGVRSIMQVVEDSEFADLEALTVIGRLFADGIVESAGAKPQPARATPARAPGLDGWLAETTTPFGRVLPEEVGAAGGQEAPGPAHSFADRLHSEGGEPARASSTTARVVAVPFPPVDPVLAARRTVRGIGAFPAAAPPGGGPDASDATTAAAGEPGEAAALGEDGGLGASTDSAASDELAAAAVAALDAAAGADDASPPPFDVSEEAVPVARAEPDNLIRFPAPVRPDRFEIAGEIGGSAPPQMAPALESSVAPHMAAAFRSLERAQRGSGPAVAGEIETGRGVPVVDESPARAVSPPPASPLASLDDPPPVAASPPPPSPPPPEVEPPAAVVEAWSETVQPASTGTTPVPPAAEEPPRPPSYAGDAAVDDDLDIALPSRRRGIVVLVAAVVIGGAAALIAVRLTATPSVPSSQVVRPVVAVNQPRPATPKPAAPPPVELPAPATVTAPGPEPVAVKQPAAPAAPEPAKAPASAEAAAPVVVPVAPAVAPPTAAAGAASAAMEECRAAFARGKFKDARAACSAAAEATGGAPPAEALTMMAHTELNLGQPREALRLAREAIDADPAQADAYVIIGGVEQDNNRMREARAAYRKYLQLAPHGRYADELRAILGVAGGADAP